MENSAPNVEETLPDVRGFNLNPCNTSKPIIIPIEDGLKFDPDSLCYDMSGDKYLIILNHHTFQRTIYFRFKKPDTRIGTHEDVSALQSLFESLDFRVTVFDDLDYNGIMKNLREVAARGHANTSCLCVTILTHGDKGGELQASDRPYLFGEILTIFEQEPTLVNKPKVFFVQACRGHRIDAGNIVQLDSESVLTVPTHADFLVLYSTVENYLSYREDNGSWMIQALCYIISNHHKDLDLLQMITLTNRKVAYERTTYYPRNRKPKQMPETRFTLTKQLKFQ